MNHFRNKDKVCQVLKIIDKNEYLITWMCRCQDVQKRYILFLHCTLLCQNFSWSWAWTEQDASLQEQRAKAAEGDVKAAGRWGAKWNMGFRESSLSLLPGEAKPTNALLQAASCWPPHPPGADAPFLSQWHQQPPTKLLRMYFLLTSPSLQLFPSVEGKNRVSDVSKAKRPSQNPHQTQEVNMWNKKDTVLSWSLGRNVLRVSEIHCKWKL